jgi:diaminohydroxyphosphoribosylaminopyrimidine deaminase/5-amino-6-(5-phosphoribosylamino)uracil reductase
VRVDPEADRGFMRRALELAGRGWGRVAPNPMVGAVVVRSGDVVGEGWHAEFGRPHAEVVALGDAGSRAVGSTLYVTLEPCTHTGKTPPCAPAVAAAGVARVVVGCLDPNPAAGGGAEALRESGLRVDVGIEGEACAAQNAAYLWNRIRESPFVALKLALSLDGALARSEGVRTAITGPESRAWTHRLRAGFDAIMVGRGTVLADDPLLTVREAPGPRRPPVRVILDSGLSLPENARVVSTTETAPTWVLCGPEAPASRRSRLEREGVRVLEVPGTDGGVDVTRAMDRLGREGVTTVLAEGGARLARSLLEARRAQRMHLLYAPVLFGADAPGGFGGVEAERGSWGVRERAALGEDTLLSLESEELVALLADHGALVASA